MQIKTLCCWRCEVRSQAVLLAATVSGVFPRAKIGVTKSVDATLGFNSTSFCLASLSILLRCIPIAFVGQEGVLNRISMSSAVSSKMSHE
jgi:hypothetical protein